MKYENLIKDFTNRTIANIEAIDKIAAGRKLKEERLTVFEITQLINSCLGLIVMPKEIYSKKIPKTPLEELEAEGWPIPSLTNPSERRNNLDLKQLIDYFRNAIAHWNIKFTHNDKDQLNGLMLWNEDESGLRRWESTLNMSDLRIFVKKLSEMIIKIIDKEKANNNNFNDI